MKRIYIILVFLLPLFLKAQTGCSDPNATNYYCNTSIDCVFGGLDSNWAPIWTLPAGFTDDGSCLGCTNPNAQNYNPLAGVDNGTCIVSGCMDDGQQSWSVNSGQAACNYDITATLNDGSCTYPVTYYDCDGDCINDTDGDGVCDELEVLGLSLIHI